MVSRHTPRAVVFDLDGTLIDSAPDITAAINTVLGETGHRELTLGEVRDMVGDGTKALVERAFAAAGGGTSPGAEALAGHIGRFRAAYDARMTAETKAYPGAAQALRDLDAAGALLGVCTNKPDLPAQTILAALGLSPFIRAIVGGETAPARKPDPQHLAAVLGILGVDPGDAVMVGDGINDVAVARALSVPVVLVSFGYSRKSPHSLGADAVIEDFALLGEAVSRVHRARS